MCPRSPVTIKRHRRRHGIRRAITSVAWSLCIRRDLSHHHPLIAAQGTVDLLLGLVGLPLASRSGELASFAFAAASNAWRRSRIINTCSGISSMFGAVKDNISRLWSVHTSQVALDFALAARITSLVSTPVLRWRRWRPTALTVVRVEGFVQRGSIGMQGGFGGGCHHRRLIAFCRRGVGVVRMDCRCKARTLESAGSQVACRYARGWEARLGQHQPGDLTVTATERRVCSQVAE